MLIYIIIIALVIVLCLYKMSTKNVDYADEDDDSGLAFYYGRGDVGKSGSGGGNSGGGKNVGKLKDAAKKAWAKADASKTKMDKVYAQAVGTNNQPVSKKEQARIDKEITKNLNLQFKAIEAQQKYEAALGKVPEMGQVNSYQNAVWTDRGWTSNTGLNTNVYSMAENNNPLAIQSASGKWVTVDGTLKNPA